MGLKIYAILTKSIKNPCSNFKNLSQNCPKGGKIMPKYEVLYIITPELSDEKKEELIEKFRGYVEAKGGKVEGVDKWGIKKLAYQINFKNEGYYVLMKLELPAQEVDAMSKLMNITEGIMRHQFVRI